MTAFRMDTKPLPNQETETGSVQITTTSNNTVLGKRTQLPGYVRQDIHRIGNHNQFGSWDCTERILDIIGLKMATFR